MNTKGNGANHAWFRMAVALIKQCNVTPAQGVLTLWYAWLINVLRAKLLVLSSSICHINSITHFASYIALRALPATYKTGLFPHKTDLMS